VAKAILLAAASPYTVTASYGGDSNFAPVAESIPYTVSPAASRMTLSYKKPTSGSPTTIVAIVKSGPGSAAVTGSVTFAVAAAHNAQGVKPFCAGTNPKVTQNNTQPLVNGRAKCVLPAGWIVVPKATTADKHPRTGWMFSASYTGNTSFLPYAKVRFGNAIK
jgi:hypothetical protein